MKKSSAKSTCKRNVTAVIIHNGRAFDVSTPEKELAFWKKAFKHAEKDHWYVEDDGSWAKYAPIRNSPTMQGFYKKAKKGDLQSLRSLLNSGLWRLMDVYDVDRFEIY